MVSCSTSSHHFFFFISSFFVVFWYRDKCHGLYCIVDFFLFVVLSYQDFYVVTSLPKSTDNFIGLRMWYFWVRFRDALATNIWYLLSVHAASHRVGVMVVSWMKGVVYKLYASLGSFTVCASILFLLFIRQHPLFWVPRARYQCFLAEPAVLTDV